MGRHLRRAISLISTAMVCPWLIRGRIWGDCPNGAPAPYFLPRNRCAGGDDAAIVAGSAMVHGEPYRRRVGRGPFHPVAAMRGQMHIAAGGENPRCGLALDQQLGLAG